MIDEERSFMDYVKGINDTLDKSNLYLKNMSDLLGLLDTFNLPEQKKLVQEYQDRFKIAVEEEFDDSCLKRPIDAADSETG